MTKVTYLDHSGFALTTDDAILVFDYYRDPSHALHKILNANPGKPATAGCRAGGAKALPSTPFASQRRRTF